MKIEKTIIFGMMMVLLLAGCGRNPLDVDISGITEEVSIIRFEQELLSPDNQPMEELLPALAEKYPDFTPLFTDQVLRVGLPEEEGTVEGIAAFRSDTMIQSAYHLSEQMHTSFDRTEKELVKAFKRYKYHFPKAKLPNIYTCISGFNESAFVGEGVIGISLDKYLGQDIAYYSMLGFPQYKQRKMAPEMIASDAVYVWAMGEFPISLKATNLMEHIVHEGKMLYFMEAMLPEVHDTLITGFTEPQLRWCRNNESQMWSFLIEHELLYSTKQMDIVRYINDGPMTNGFPPESPGRTGAWIGWQIIRKYMKKFPETTLPQLMANQNYQKILTQSGYLP